MDLSVANANTALNAIVNTGTTYYLGLKRVTLGSRERTRLSAAGFRQAIQFTSGASSGSTASTDSQAFTSMPAVTITNFSIWSASTSGTFEYGGSWRVYPGAFGCDSDAFNGRDCVELRMTEILTNSPTPGSVVAFTTINGNISSTSALTMSTLARPLQRIRGRGSRSDHD